MRDRWFGDNRDLVKWATLTHIASERGLKSILQVPYWRPEESLPRFSFDGKSLAIPDKVWRFFRNIHSITQLGLEVWVSIKVVDKEFKPDHRDAYLSEVKTNIHHTSRPLALFLDPDTGLQPKRCCPEHTAKEDIKTLWPVLKAGEWLVLYQHARFTHNWRESVANELSSLCSNRKAHIGRSYDIGKDAALICVEKA
jgi:hypothetical protein